MKLGAGRATKDDIIDYSIKNNIKYFEDESNKSFDYTRNRIRHNMIPLMFEENPSFNEQFKEFKETLVNSYKIVCEKRNQIIKDIVVNSKDNITININKFNELREKELK